MSRLTRPFRRLRWQLTLFYIMITLVAALTRGVATSVASILTPKPAAATPSETLMNAMSFTEAPQIAPYLEQSPPDRHALGVWAAIWAHGFTYSKMGFSALPTNQTGLASQIPLDSDSAQDVTVVIADRNGQALASASEAPSSLGGLIASQPVQATLRAALSENTKRGPSLPTSALADGRTVATAPIAAYNGGPTLGALLVVARIASGPPGAPTKLINQLVTTIRSVLPSTLALVILASVVGTLFGVAASRGITRRLRGITLAAQAWSRGEFQAVVRDTRHDELGLLAADLNAMAEQLQRLVFARQELAVVEERHRLARDLHDSVKQQTFVIAMLVGAARNLVAGNSDAERALTEAEQLAGQTQRELTALIRALRPVSPAGADLNGALRNLCDDWSQRTGVTIQLDTPHGAFLTSGAQQELFLVAQEALTNVARHSGATAVELHVYVEREHVVLTIKDDGHGFDPDQLTGQGLGLSSMRERVKALGGTWRITSSASGTSVNARIPISHQAPAAW